MEVELNDQFTAYVKRMQKVRLLSTPSLDDINEADDYSRLLLENFRKSGNMPWKTEGCWTRFCFHFLSWIGP